MIDTARRAAVRLGLGASRLPHRLWGRWQNERHFARACDRVPSILVSIPARDDALPPATWRVQRAERTRTGVVVISVGPVDQPPRAVVKLPQTREGVAGLQRQRAVHTALHADARLGEWRSLVPKPLAAGAVAGQFYTAEEALPGRAALPLVSDPKARMRLQIGAAAAIGELHRRTARSVLVDDAMLERWIDRPLLVIRRLHARRPPALRNDAAIERLRTELYGALTGRRLCASWIHGDFWPANILVGPDAATLTGIVDWDRAAPDELPLHDVLHLLLYTRKLLQHCEPGEIVRALLGGGEWTRHERALLDAAELPPPDAAAGERAMVLLYWLRFIAANLLQSTYFGRNRWWVTKNIDDVLRCL